MAAMIYLFGHFLWYRHSNRVAIKGPVAPMAEMLAKCPHLTAEFQNHKARNVPDKLAPIAVNFSLRESGLKLENK